MAKGHSGPGWASRTIIAAGIFAVLIAIVAVTGGRLPRMERFVLDGVVIDPNVPVRHRKVYRLEVWETALTIPARPHRFQGEFNAAMQMFHDRYPKVQVDVTFVPEEEMEAKLAEALAAGSPPDVAALREPLLGAPHQVPVEHYLPPVPRSRDGEDEVLYYAAARDPWTSGEHVWGFPRWIAWHAWLGHDERLRELGMDVDGAVRYGWTWDDLLALADKAKERGGNPSMFLDGRDPVLAMQLVANAGAPWWEAVEGLAWSRASMEPVARLLQTLAAGGAMPKVRPGRPFNRVVGFLDERGVLMGPVNAYLYQAVQERAPDVVLLPVPHHPEHREVSTLIPSGYAVFRRPGEDGEGPGDDHLRAAMELAYFLSRRMGLAGAQHVGFLPASPRDMHPWSDRATLHHLARNFLLDYLSHFPGANGRPPVARFIPPPEARGLLEEALADLWREEETDPGRWADGLVRRLRSVTTNSGARSSNPTTGAPPR